MKTSTTTALAITATTVYSGAYGNELDYVPECGITCVDYAVKAQGCDPLLQECYCGWGFHTPWKDCILKTCEREELPNAYIWGHTRCDPGRHVAVAPGFYDSWLETMEGTELPPLPLTPPAWSASPTFLSDSDWALETPRSIKSSVRATAAAEPIAAEPIALDEPIAFAEPIEKRGFHTTAAAESTTKASATSPTATSTKPATVPDSGSGMNKAVMASAGLVSVAVMFLLM